MSVASVERDVKVLRAVHERNLGASSRPEGCGIADDCDYENGTCHPTLATVKGNVDAAFLWGGWEVCNPCYAQVLGLLAGHVFEIHMFELHLFE